jgi:hypothetical protein
MIRPALVILTIALAGALGCGGRDSGSSPALTCNDNGTVHANGTFWACSDGCNSCSCNNGKIGSTLIGCSLSSGPDGSSGVGASSGAASGAAGSGSDSGSEGGTGDILDAEIPDAFPATCTEYTFSLDAAADTCGFTPADVACNSNADCTTYVKIGCGCFDPVYGVNTTNTVRCVAPPCGVPLNADGGIYTCPADTSGLYTQDCRFVPDSLSVAAVCVNHQCLTYAVAPGSE